MTPPPLNRRGLFQLAIAAIAGRKAAPLLAPSTVLPKYSHVKYGFSFAYTPARDREEEMAQSVLANGFSSEAQ